MAKKKKPPPAIKDRDWSLIKQAYLAERASEGSVNLKKLAVRFKLPYGTLRNRVSKYKWNQTGEEMEAEVNAKVRERVLPQIVDKRVEAITSQLAYVDYVKKRAMKAITQTETMAPALAIKALFDAMKTELSLLEAQTLATPTNTAGSTQEDTIAMFKDFAASLSGGKGGVSLSLDA